MAASSTGDVAKPTIVSTQASTAMMSEAFFFVA